MPVETLHSPSDWRTTALPTVVSDTTPSQEQRSIDRYAYWSGRKRFDRCDVCGRMETIQGEVRTLVNGVLVRSAAIGDCGRWMFEMEHLTDAQKDALLAAAAMGEEVPVLV